MTLSSRSHQPHLPAASLTELAGGSRVHPVLRAPEEHALITHTSGTTGLSKPVVHMPRCMRLRLHIDGRSEGGWAVGRPRFRRRGEPGRRAVIRGESLLHRGPMGGQRENLVMDREHRVVVPGRKSEP